MNTTTLRTKLNSIQEELTILMNEEFPNWGKISRLLNQQSLFQRQLYEGEDISTVPVDAAISLVDCLSAPIDKHVADEKIKVAIMSDFLAFMKYNNREGELGLH